MSPSLTEVHGLHASLRAARPLVQNITNYVAMTVSANVLLALGASPAMVHAAEEAEDFSAISAALVVNIGTLTPTWVEGMCLAAEAYHRRSKPWVLDPVGVGATTLRNEAAARLLARHPSVVRGNASEILALAGVAGTQVKGVDSTAGSDAAVEAAIGLARSSGAVVAVTGEVDYVTDGTRVTAITGGHALMPLSTALGCALSASVAAFTTQTKTFEATVAALAVYGAAGRMAGEACAADGPGFMPQRLCDALHSLDLDGLTRNTSIRNLA